MNKVLLLFSFLLLVTACKPSQKKLISKKWKAVSIESPEMSPARIAETRYFFDTVGTTTTPEENQMLYGVRNMDSMRLILKEQLNMMLAQQERTIQNTWLHFLNNGTVATNFGMPKPDTVSWYFEDEQTLVLDEMKHKGTGSKVNMEVLKLEKDLLQLRFNENGFTSTATFKPAE